jgi:hypothetical protein
MPLFSFIKSENRRAKQVLPGRVVTSRKREVVGKRVRGRIWCKYCVHVYINGKMRPVETIPGMGEERIRENDGKGEFKYDISDTL